MNKEKKYPNPGLFAMLLPSAHAAHSMETDWRWDCMQVSIRALPKEAAVDHN
jgi:hypothetical protein